MYQLDPFLAMYQLDPFLTMYQLDPFLAMYQLDPFLAMYQLDPPPPSSLSWLRIPSVDGKRKKKRLGFRAFSDAALKLWKALPQTLREHKTSTTFRKSLKIYLFSADC